MIDPQALTLAFLQTHTAEATRVIEALPSEQAASLMAELPARVVAPVLAEMLPPAAARLLTLLEDSQAVAVLSSTPTLALVAILRHVPEHRRSSLLGGLPTMAAMASRVLLGFPEDSVGAWTDPEVCTVGEGARVADALQRLRQWQGAKLDEIHVIDGARRLLGTVSVHALLCAGEGAPIGTLALRPVAVLSAMMPLASAVSLPAWSEVSALPVSDSGQRMLGVLRHATLTQIERERDRDRDRSPRQTGGAVGLLAQAYWDLVCGLMEASTGMLATLDRVLPEEQ